MDSQKDGTESLGSSRCSSSDCNVCNGKGGRWDEESQDQWYWCDNCDAAEKYYEGRRKSFCLVIGPIEADLDGFTAEDRKEWLEDAGWQNVTIKWS